MSMPTLENFDKAGYYIASALGQALAQVRKQIKR
jgi:hypothetical protein